MNIGNATGNFTGNKGASTPGRFVVEQNSIKDLHAICLTVVDKDPECVLLGNSIRGTGVEWGSLRLGNLLHLSVEFRSGSLVELDLLFKTTGADSVEHTEDTDSIAISSVFGHIEGNLNVTHGSKVIDLGGANVGDDGDKIGGIAKVTVVEEELDSGLVPVLVDVIDTASVEN